MCKNWRPRSIPVLICLCFHRGQIRFTKEVNDVVFIFNFKKWAKQILLTFIITWVFIKDV